MAELTCVLGLCYNRGMTNTPEENVSDATREAIVAKIEAKRTSNEKTESKVRNLNSQIEVYENSVINYEAKIEAAKARADLFRTSLKTHEEDAERRALEIEHMEEILERYDLAVEDRSRQLQIMATRMEEIPDWYPGMDPELKGALRRDPEYKEALAKKEYYDQVMEIALSDIRKIYVSRGEVSGINAKVKPDVQ